MSVRRRPRHARVFAVAAAAGLVSAPGGWIATDHLERDDDFCNACHLEPGVPLHIELRRDFDARPAASLAARHGAVHVEEGEGARTFRCIDCHGGTGPIGRARVKALAAADAFWYVLGRFDEPVEMRWPLWDEDCGKCHAVFDESRAEAWRRPRFHQLPLHNVALGVSCVECHLSHGPGGNPGAQFLHAARVRAQCARCHSEFEEGYR
jgi:nitrate/TMAO reductase-like tetraheme cytochrome c subunit